MWHTSGVKILFLLLLLLLFVEDWIKCVGVIEILVKNLSLLGTEVCREALLLASVIRGKWICGWVQGKLVWWKIKSKWRYTYWQ